MPYTDEQYALLKELLHELRTPVAALGYKLKSPIEQQSIQLIRDLCARYEKIVEGRSEIRKIPVSLRNVVEDTLLIFSGFTGEPGIAVVGTSVDADILVDPLLVRQVLLNILSNAYAHNHAHLVDITTSISGNYVVICINNSSKPYTSASAETVYGALSSTNTHWGVGVPLSSSLVHSMGGQILSEDHSYGRLVTITLPLAL